MYSFTIDNTLSNARANTILAARNSMLEYARICEEMGGYYSIVSAHKVKVYWPYPDNCMQVLTLVRIENEGRK